MSETAPVITVDGPSGTGKGTLCAALALTLDWHLLDSGALYRALALRALAAGTDLGDDAALAAVGADLRVEFRVAGSAEIRVVQDGRDVTDELRTEACARGASRVAAVPAVRSCLLEAQRAFRRPPGLIADGRDMGTVVFPDARLKIFLSASPDERARRRYNQLKQKGLDVNLARLSRDIAQRDERDMSRSASPLRPAPDAVQLDTTELDIQAVLDSVLVMVRERGLKEG